MLITFQPLLPASAIAASEKVPTHGIWKPPRLSVGILALDIIVNHKHHQPRVIPSLRPLCA